MVFYQLGVHFLPRLLRMLYLIEVFFDLFQESLVDHFAIKFRFYGEHRLEMGKDFLEGDLGFIILVEMALDLAELIQLVGQKWMRNHILLLEIFDVQNFI